MIVISSKTQNKTAESTAVFVFAHKYFIEKKNCHTYNKGGGKMYKFCKGNGCWWRVCSTLSELLEWHEHTNGRYGKALEEDVHDSGEKYKNIRDLSRILAEKNKTSFIGGMAIL